MLVLYAVVGRLVGGRWWRVAVLVVLVLVLVVLAVVLFAVGWRWCW